MLICLRLSCFNMCGFWPKLSPNEKTRCRLYYREWTSSSFNFAIIPQGHRNLNSKTGPFGYLHIYSMSFVVHVVYCSVQYSILWPAKQTQHIKHLGLWTDILTMHPRITKFQNVRPNVPEEMFQKKIHKWYEMHRHAWPCMTALPMPSAVEVGGGLATFKAQEHWWFNLLTYIDIL